MKVKDVIQQIQNIRNENNKNWMDLLRLAFKHAPKEAGKIMARISRCDTRINTLTKKMTDRKD